MIERDLIKMKMKKDKMSLEEYYLNEVFNKKWNISIGEYLNLQNNDIENLNNLGYQKVFQLHRDDKNGKLLQLEFGTFKDKRIEKTLKKVTQSFRLHNMNLSYDYVGGWSKFKEKYQSLTYEMLILNNLYLVIISVYILFVIIFAANSL